MRSGCREAGQRQRLGLMGQPIGMFSPQHKRFGQNVDLSAGLRQAQDQIIILTPAPFSIRKLRQYRPPDHPTWVR